jgi:LruC domain-containing protein
MKHLRWIIPMIVTVILVVNSSCSPNHELFDAEATQVISDSLSPVDSIDKNHNWVLTDTRSITVTANADVNARWLKILTADPRRDPNAEVATQVMIADGESTFLSFCYPKTLTTLYAALVDDQGLFTVKDFTPSDLKVDFSDPLYTKQLITYIPQPQSFVYLYEDEMPDYLTVDFDFNDIILNIAYERTGEREMRFHVELAAVGTTRQASAAIRLKNFKYDEIESVTTVGNTSFNMNNKGEEVPDQILSPNILREKELLLKSHNKERDEDQEAVINLFCDGHWATGAMRSSEENYGMMERKYYNVNKGSGTGYQTMVPREVTYVVTFKEKTGLEYLNFDLIDPFIIKEYNGGTFEVHQFAYRNDWVLKEYKIPDEIVKLPWALIVPYKKFRHTLEGVNIGFKKKDVMGFGAYSKVRGHTFGEWSSNYNVAQDWYLNEYATENQVY